MKMRAVLTVVTATLLIAAAAAQTSDESAIRQVVANFDAALSKGDGKAVAALFTTDADYLSSTGRMARGPAQIETLIAEQAAGAFKGLTFTTTIDTVRMVRPDVAIATGSFAAATRKGLVTFIVVRDSGRWRITGLRAAAPPAK